MKLEVNLLFDTLKFKRGKKMDYYWHQRQQQFYYQPYQINNVVPIASVRDYGDYKTSNKKNNNAEAIKTFSHADNDAAIHPPDYYYYYYVVQDDEEGDFNYFVSFFLVFKTRSIALSLLFVEHVEYVPQKTHYFNLI